MSDRNEVFIHGLIADTIGTGANDGMNEVIAVYEPKASHVDPSQRLIYVLHGGAKVMVRITRLAGMDQATLDSEWNLISLKGDKS